MLGVTGLFVLLFVFTGFVGLLAAGAAAAAPPDTAAPTAGGSHGSGIFFNND